MKNDIKVTVEVEFLENQSNIVDNLYAYAYTIIIRNQGEIGAQLHTRHWKIQDETGYTEEIFGEGVVGHQPHLKPGEQFEYSSGALIKTKTGSMKGVYNMMNDDGEQFVAKVPKFILAKPHTLH